MIMYTLLAYKGLSGNKINKEKSNIYLDGKVSIDVVITTKVFTGIGRKEFSFTFLGCSIFFYEEAVGLLQTSDT